MWMSARDARKVHGKAGLRPATPRTVTVWHRYLDLLLPSHCPSLVDMLLKFVRGGTARTGTGRGPRVNACVRRGDWLE